MLKICYCEEDDIDFIRWTSNLLHKFLLNGSIEIVEKKNNPDLMLASVWRKHELPNELPIVLVSNENWRLWPGHYPPSIYSAIIAITPPAIKTAFVAYTPPPFISYPYEIVHFGNSYDALANKRAKLIKREKKKFCCFVVSNATYGDLAQKRYEIFSKINAYKQVDSAGRAHNNVGYFAPKGDDFLEWISEYKFMICPENSNFPGYITEKALQAYIAGTIPIYCGGNQDILNDNAYIDASKEDYLSKIITIDQNETALTSMLSESLYKKAPSLHSFEEKFEKLIKEFESRQPQ